MPGAIHYLISDGTPCGLAEGESFRWTRIKAYVTCPQCKNALRGRS